MPDEPADDFHNVLFSYTRKQAIEDGVLADVSEIAKEAGFKLPVAVTCRVWAEVVTPTEDEKAQWGQSESGRLWDVLQLLRAAIRQAPDASVDQVAFSVLIQRSIGMEEVALRAVCGPGDDPAPVITIMAPDED